MHTLVLWIHHSGRELFLGLSGREARLCLWGGGEVGECSSIFQEAGIGDFGHHVMDFYTAENPVKKLDE